MKCTIVFLFLVTSYTPAQNVTVLVWNGVPDQKALFYGYLSLEGKFPIARGSTVWIPAGKGFFYWDLPAVNSLDNTMTLYGDFNVDANLINDEKNNPNQLLVPIWTTSIHCEATAPSGQALFTVLFVEDLSGSQSKYHCVVQN